MNGFVNVLKPVGATASDVVVCAKRVLHEKVGHLGTLDPGASGVLPLAVGQATKLFNFLTDKVKYYRAFFTFGKTTDTLDSYGNVTCVNGFVPDKEQLTEALKSFVGKLSQVPPAYSAKSVNGVRAYSLARSGVDVELHPREVTVYDISLVEQRSEDTFVLDIRCSAGTYIRSLARDVAYACQSLGYMSGLIRLASGPFLIEDSYTLDELRELGVKALSDVMYPIRDVDEYRFEDKYFNDLDHGRKVPCFFADGYRKIYCKDIFFGLGKNSGGYLDLQYYMKNMF